MAVEVNKRKRKHANASEDGDVVPKKVAKKIKSPKKHKTLKTQDKPDSNMSQEQIVNGALPENVEIAETEVEMLDDSMQGGWLDNTEKELKFSKDFKMLDFRNKLKGVNFMTELRHFLHLTKVRPKIVAKFIEKRGKPLEFAEALERIDKSNVLHIAYLCEAMQLVTLEILTNQKNHLETAVNTCRYFLKNHCAVLELLFKSSQLQHRRIALKLLTAIVCVEPQLGRQLLSSYDILSNVRTIENFLSHSKFEVYEEETVRKCFIHFVLSYLVDGNTLLIRNILDRGTVIHALVSGLIYDDHVTVCVVLNTLRKYVLECAEISKTKKTHVFDLECCKHFMRLYDWHGPKVFAAKFSGKHSTGGKANLQHSQINELVDAHERDAVSAAVHEFLVVLLTSRKHGIAFDAISLFRQKHNSLQGKLIGFLYKPWCDERKTELVIKILNACPDLARHTVRNFSSIVNPMHTPYQDWVAAVNFLTKIINTLHPKLLRNALEKLTLTDLSYWIKDICLPIETLVLLTGSKMLRHANFSFRLATNRLLLAMFTQYANYMAAITKREQAKGGSNSMRRFKFDVLNHILVNYPTVEDILYSLYMSIEGQERDDVSVLAHLEVALDLLLIICKENRSFVNKTATILDYLQLLRPLYADDNAPAEDNRGNIKLELKAIKTIMLLFPKALEPTEELFRGVLKSFIKAFVYGTPEVKQEAGMLLRDIFENTGLFDSGELEIDLWLEPLRFFDTKTVDVVIQVFIEVLQVTKADVDLPKSTETTTNEGHLHKLFENIEKGLSVQAYVEPLSLSKLMALIFKGVEIVEPLDQYLETVCLLMYHYYPMPEHVLQLYELEFKSFKAYMRSWVSPAEQELPLHGEVVERLPKFKQVQTGILSGKAEFESIFENSGDEDDHFEIELNGKFVKLCGSVRNDRLLMIYVQEVLFLVMQLFEKHKLTRNQAANAARFVNNCLSVVRKIDLDGEDSDANSSKCFLGKMLKYIYSVRLSYNHSIELFNANDESNLSYLHFLRELTEHCHEMENFDNYAANFRLRIVKAVALSLQSLEESKSQSDKLAETIKLVQVFNLSAENCIEILDLLAMQLKYSDFYVLPTWQKSVYHDLLVVVLQRLTALKKSVQCDMFVMKFVKFYTSLVKKSGQEANLEQLEEAFYNFLLVSHQYIPRLDKKFFDCMFVERKLTKSTIKLAALLLERDDKLNEEFLRHLPNNVDKRELVYPLLNVAFRKKLSLEPTLLQSIYQSYKNGFMKTIEKPQKAGAIYKEHVECSVTLIEQCMPKSECVDFCNKNFKFDVVEIYQMRIINAIYKKALSTLRSESSQQQLTIFVNYINLQIQMLAVDLKKQLIEVEKLEMCAYFLYDWWQQTTEGVPAWPELELDYSKVLKSQHWLNFCKTCLKLGMNMNEAEVGEQQTDELHGLLLKLLAYLCDQLYGDFFSEAAEARESTEPAQLFEMICTHSKFYDIILSQHATKVKTSVLQLLYTLAKKSPSSLTGELIPLILGAYQAKLADADRYALALLQLCEQHDCGLQQYRPFIWGESAIVFYSLRSAEEERAKLSQQETSIAQVMSLVDKQVSEYTTENFPIWRKLNATAQLPSVEFENPALNAFVYGSNSLERRIDLGQTEFTLAELRLCPKRAGIYENCYDPAFFIPLMSMCFAPEAYAHPARPVQNGLLGLVFSALSSQDKDMRLAAGCVQLRYRAHFEHNKFYERPLWIQAYDNIQAGLNDLRESWLKHKKNSGTPRVPFISGLFVAKTFNLTTDPTHFLYKQLTMYLRLKNSFNFQVVPEFNVLFYSPEIEHHAFRQFIVEVIRNGIKSSSDLFLLVTTNTFKVLMGFYGSTMSTLILNLLILSVFSTCVKIPASTKIMVEHIGILPWLASIIGSIEFYHFDVIEGVISILNNLWYALKANAAEFHNFEHLSLEIHHLVLLLLPHLSARISIANFAKLLNLLQKTAASQHLAMSPTQLDLLIDCAGKHFPSHVQAIQSIKTFGGSGAASQVEYCRYLHQQQLDVVAVRALSSLRAYTITWWQRQNDDLKRSATDIDVLKTSEE